MTANKWVIYNSLGNIMHRICTKAGIPDYHSLRVSAATKLFQKDVHKQLIMRPTITWSRSSRSALIPITDNDWIYQLVNGTLGFFPAREEDTGVYTCKATNSEGSRRNQTLTGVTGHCSIDRVSGNCLGHAFSLTSPFRKSRKGRCYFVIDRDLAKGS